MLSDEEKNEMLSDAHNDMRKAYFARSKQYVSNHSMTGQQFMNFLMSLTQFLSQPKKPHKISGSIFRL